VTSETRDSGLASEPEEGFVADEGETGGGAVAAIEQEFAAAVQCHQAASLPCSATWGRWRTYSCRFPEDPARTDLDLWDVFESENPYIFTDMYVFVVQSSVG